MGIFQVVPKQSWLGQETRNVLYYSAPDNLTPTQKLTLCTNIADVWDEHIRGFLVDDWSMYAFDVRRVDIAAQPTLEFVPAGFPMIGGAVTDSVATQVALLATYSAATPRPNRGRSYLCGLNEGEITNSLWNFDTIVFFNEFVTALRNPEYASGQNAAQHIARWNASNTAISLSNPVSGGQCSNLPATQRSRRRS
jgi:hypothetical protein